MPRLRLLLSFLCLLLASASSAHPSRPHTQPRLQTRIALRESDSALQRLRGGRGGGTNGAAEARARLLLLASNAGFGSYSVFLRALGKVPGALPLGTVFITFVRYNVLFLLATVTRGVRALQARCRPKHITAGVAEDETHGTPHLAAFELAFYSVASALLSVWGTCRVTAAMSEIFASTDNLFVPLISVLLGMDDDFGVRTWLACVLSCGAAVVVAIIDSLGDHGGAAALDLPGAAALVASAVMYASFRVRTTRHLRFVSAASLNLLRMCWMGAMSTVMLLLDVACGAQLPPRAVREAELASRVLGEVPGGAEEMTRLARQRLVKRAKREERLKRKEAQKRATGERKRMRFQQLKDKKEEKKAGRQDAK